MTVNEDNFRDHYNVSLLTNEGKKASFTMSITPGKNIIAKIDKTAAKLGPYKIISIRKNTCIGCIYNEPNQESHMDIGGCLYEK